MAPLGGDQVLLFGGQEGSGISNGETWVYDLSANSWTNQTPASGPSARYGHAMATLGGDQVLLFGGQDDSGYNGETWVYDLSANSWTNQAPVDAPSARFYPAMAYLGGDQVLLFGGFDGSGLSGETWVYDLSANTWTNQSPAATEGTCRAARGCPAQSEGTGPSARHWHAMASAGGNQVLLFGGVDASGHNGETWLATGFYSGIRYQTTLPLVVK